MKTFRTKLNVMMKNFYILSILLPVAVAGCILPPAQAIENNSQPLRKPLHNSAPSTTSKRAGAPHASATPSHLADYYIKEAGLKVSYPRGWHIDEHPEKDTLVKFSDPSSAAGANLSIQTAANDGGMSLDTFCRLAQDVFYSALKNYKKLEGHTIRFGKNSQMTGFCQDITFEIAGVTVKQRLLTFLEANHFITVSFSALDNQFNRLNPLCNELLLSISEAGPRLSSSNTVATGSATAAASASTAMNWQLANCSSGHSPVSFSYPKDWQVETPDDPNHSYKIVSKDPGAAGGEISLYCGDMHPYTTLEQNLQSIEDKYWANRKNFRLANQRPCNFGSNSSIQGITQEMSFDMNGVPVRSRVVSFQHKEKLYVLSLLSTNMKDSDLQLLFSKILASVNTSN